MNKSIWIGIAVVVIVGLGLWYVLAMPPAAPATNTQDQSATTTAQGGTTSTGGSTTTTSLRAATTQGGNYTCTLETTSSGQHTLGTLYGAGGKTRVDLSLQNNGTTVTMHIIRSNGYSYTWVDGQSVGTKMAITGASPIVAQPSGGVISVTDEAIVASECHPWLTDASVFVAPKGITFK